jgi:hypothetical protein
LATVKEFLISRTKWNWPPNFVAFTRALWTRSIPRSGRLTSQAKGESACTCDAVLETHKYSYAGYYVPYIADGFISANDNDYFNLAGIQINDPIIGDETIQQQVVILPYVEFWQNLLYLNETFMEAVRERQDACNYSSYMDTYFKFPPPKGPFPVLTDPYSTEDGACDQFDNFYAAILEVNPCFNIYHITETCPQYVLQSPQLEIPQFTNYT